MFKKEINRKKRHFRIRKKCVGTAECPRLVVRRSLKNLHVQVVDDVQGMTLVGVSTLAKAVKEKCAQGGNIAAAKELGSYCADQLKNRGIERIAFDRAGYQYHGRIKVFADSLREKGIKF